MRKAMRVTQKKAAAELGLSAATLALGTGETAVDETGEEVLRAPVRIGESAPANCLLTTYRSVGFVAKKVRLVSGTRFFTALPKKRSSSVKRGLQNREIMNRCCRSPQITVRYRTHPQRAVPLRLNKYTSMELRKRGPFYELQDRLCCRRRRVGKPDCLSGCLLRL